MLKLFNIEKKIRGSKERGYFNSGKGEEFRISKYNRKLGRHKTRIKLILWNGGVIQYIDKKKHVQMTYAPNGDLKRLETGNFWDMLLTRSFCLSPVVFEFNDGVMIRRIGSNEFQMGWHERLYMLRRYSLDQSKPKTAATQAFQTKIKN